MTKEKLLNNLAKLNTIIELPNLYLSDYLCNLRNKVDRECALKQQELQNDKEKNIECL